MDETRVFKIYSGSELLRAADAALGYDFAGAGYYEDGSAGLFPGLPKTAPVPRRREKEWVRERQDGGLFSRSLRRQARGISFVTVGGFLLAAVLLVLVLLAQIRLTALSDSAAAAESSIRQLQTQQDKLRAEYATTFSLEEVEDYAVNVLGMQKPGAEQIVYLQDLDAQDRAVVLAPEEENLISQSLRSLADCLRSYFGGGL